MKVKCIANTGASLSTKSIEAGQLITSEFQLEIGAIYTVYGISLWKGALAYLTMDKHYTLPFWHPVELFEMVDNMLSVDWYHKFYGYNDEYSGDYFINALWGYSEIIFDERHYDDLIERDGVAVNIFLKRKKDIDEFNER